MTQERQYKVKQILEKTAVDTNAVVNEGIESDSDEEEVLQGLQGKALQPEWQRHMRRMVNQMADCLKRRQMWSLVEMCSVQPATLGGRILHPRGKAGKRSVGNIARAAQLAEDIYFGEDGLPWCTRLHESSWVGPRCSQNFEPSARSVKRSRWLRDPSLQRVREGGSTRCQLADGSRDASRLRLRQSFGRRHGDRQTVEQTSRGAHWTTGYSVMSPCRARCH